MKVENWNAKLTEEHQNLDRGLFKILRFLIHLTLVCIHYERVLSYGDRLLFYIKCPRSFELAVLHPGTFSPILY